MEKIKVRDRDHLITIVNRSAVNADLNHLDVSEVTSMHGLFHGSLFNGNISEWDVSNVTDMGYMFYFSKFNGDISKWDVSNVRNMSCMFYESKFDGDISKWKIINADMRTMIHSSVLETKYDLVTTFQAKE